MGFKIKIPGMPKMAVVPPVNQLTRHIPVGVTEETKEKLVEAMSPEKRHPAGDSQSRAAEAQSLAQSISPVKRGDERPTPTPTLKTSETDSSQTKLSAIPAPTVQSPKSPNSVLGNLSGAIYPSVRRRSIRELLLNSPLPTWLSVCLL